MRPTPTNKWEYYYLLIIITIIGRTLWTFGKGGCSGWGVQWMAGTSGATNRTLTQTTAKRKEMQQGETRIHQLTLCWALLCMKCFIGIFRDPLLRGPLIIGSYMYVWPCLAECSYK